jgi:hypothetical protein
VQDEQMFHEKYSSDLPFFSASTLSTDFLELLKIERVMCHYRVILGFNESALESQISIAK